ncbi:M24 family metallopeptidase [Paenibacillus sp. CAU 1782]
MESPLSRLEAGLTAQGLDAALITDPKHIYYLTGFASNPHERFLGLVLAPGQEPLLIVPALDAEDAASASSVKNIATHSDTDNPYALLHRYRGQLKSMGLEKDYVTVSRYEQLTAALGSIAFSDIGSLLRSLRVKKTPEEVSRIRRAITLIQEVLTQGLSHVRAGVTEIELVAEMEYRMKKLGAEGPSFDTMVLSGPKTGLPHGTPGDRKLQHGDLLMFDMGVYADGYASDITRTFAFGDISPELKEIYDTVLAANLAAIQAVKPGRPCADIDRAAREVIEAAGYGERFMHRVGHGLGIDVHEYPSLHGQNFDLLQEGCVFTIEPGIYIAGAGGVRIEDDVLVTANGVEVLTSYPKELQILG